MKVIVVTSIALVDKISEKDTLSFLGIDKPKIFTLDISTHKIFEKKKIIHEIGENYLTTADRSKIYDLVIKLHNWYDDQNFSGLEFSGINILSMLDTNEFHTYIIQRLIKFLTIKRIIEDENPEKIIISYNLHSIIQTLTLNKKIRITTIDISTEENLAWDRLNIILKIKSIQIPISISRKKYLFIKNILESITCKLFNLWFNPSKQKKTILLLEMEPTSYSKLIFNLKKFDDNIVFLNSRRSATWSFQSIKTLYKSGGKIIKSDHFIDKKTKSEITIIVNDLSKKLEKFWNNEEVFNKLFNIEGHSFWSTIKDVLIRTYSNRLQEYVSLIILSQKIFEKLDVKCIVCINEVGETEKGILGVNNKRKPSILLEHGFMNYTKEIEKYDTLSYYHLLHDKIAVWGDIQKQYLEEIKSIEPKKIITCGSPKHDFFFEKKKTRKNNRSKTILLTTHPIIELVGEGGTIMHTKFEEFLKKLCTVIKNMPNTKLIVKLHPGPDEHHHIINKLINQIDPSIKVFQSTSILDLLQISDVIVNVSEFYSPSTVIMEAMILEKPIMYVSLFDQIPSFEFIKDNAVLITSDDDLEKNLHDIVFDTKLQQNLIDNGKKYLSRYLTNPGHASEFLAQKINSL